MATLLMVDDEPRTLDALEKHIDWAACGVSAVFRAESLDGAMQVMGRESIDILLSDIEMPGGSGLDLVALLREGGAEIPCLLLTCHTDYSFMRSAIQLGVVDYVSKPVNYAELSEAVARTAHKLETREASGAEASPEAPPDILERVKQYVRAHMVEPITVGDIAQELHFHPKYLSRAFRQRSGVGISDYIAGERMKAAKRFLSESILPVGVVGELVGYPDSAYFARVFKAETGLSPSQYRQSCAKK